MTWRTRYPTTVTTTEDSGGRVGGGYTSVPGQITVLPGATAAPRQPMVEGVSVTAFPFTIPGTSYVYFGPLTESIPNDGPVGVITLESRELRYPPGLSRGFSTTEFGTAVHQNFGTALAAQTGTDLEDWILRTKPGQTGVDATYIGGKALGFRHAELKPSTYSSFEEFTFQLDGWIEAGHVDAGTTSLWLYNSSGVIGSSGFIF